MICATKTSRNRLQTVTNPSTTRNLTQTTSRELLTDDRGIGQTFAFVHDCERRPKSVSANAAPSQVRRAAIG